MNQIFSGSTLLGVVLLITFVLFAIAFFIKPKATTARPNAAYTNKPNSKKPNSKIINSKEPNKQQPNYKKGESKRLKFQSQLGSFSNAPKSQLVKLKKQIAKHFPDFNAILREQHLILERNAKKVAMLTLDANAALGRRRLGDVTVINFHKLPSIEELRIELSGV